MTSYNVAKLLAAYQKLVDQRFNETADDDVKAEMTHARNLLASADRFNADGRVVSAARVLGVLERVLSTACVINMPSMYGMLEPPDAVVDPPGVPVVEVKVGVMFTTQVGALLEMVRRVRLPVGVRPDALLFPNIDPDRRLAVLEDLGIRPDWQVVSDEWDFTDGSMSMYLKPVFVDVRLSEESVGLAVGFYKNVGWEVIPKCGNWAERLVEHRELVRKSGGHSPNCLSGMLAQMPPGVHLQNVVSGLMQNVHGNPVDSAEAKAIKEKRRADKRKKKGQDDAGGDPV